MFLERKDQPFCQRINTFCLYECYNADLSMKDVSIILCKYFERQMPGKEECHFSWSCLLCLQMSKVIKAHVILYLKFKDDMNQFWQTHKDLLLLFVPLETCVCQSFLWNNCHVVIFLWGAWKFHFFPHFGENISLRTISKKSKLFCTFEGHIWTKCNNSQL